MKPDRRLNWEYKDCMVSSVACYHQSWGKCNEPQTFADGVHRARFWVIEMPGDRWVYAPTKQAVLDYLDGLCPSRFVSDGRGKTREIADGK